MHTGSTTLAHPIYYLEHLSKIEVYYNDIMYPGSTCTCSFDSITWTALLEWVNPQ